MDDKGMHSLLADDCGLAKTLTALIRIYHDLQRIQDGTLRPLYHPTLVVCPWCWSRIGSTRSSNILATPCLFVCGTEPRPRPPTVL
jgi:hypothetical protein